MACIEISPENPLAMIVKKNFKKIIGKRDVYLLRAQRTRTREAIPATTPMTKAPTITR
jgi:hypothetical protein